MYNSNNNNNNNNNNNKIKSKAEWYDHLIHESFWQPNILHPGVIEVWFSIHRQIFQSLLDRRMSADFQQQRIFVDLCGVNVGTSETYNHIVSVTDCIYVYEISSMLPNKRNNFSTWNESYLCCSGIIRIKLDRWHKTQ